MIIYLGADHRGFNLKEKLKDFLHNQGYEIDDLGAKSYDKSDDYPDFATPASEKISSEPDRDRAILICGSGVGMDVVANKFEGVRSVLAISPDQVYGARHDDNANVLSLAADFITEEDALKIVGIFLATPFSGEERYKKRLDKISKLENL